MTIIAYSIPYLTFLTIPHFLIFLSFCLWLVEESNPVKLV